MCQQPVRVFLASDREIVVNALSACLNADRDLETTATTDSDEDAFRTIREIEPDVILLDSNRIGLAVRLEASSVETVILLLFIEPIRAVHIMQVAKLGIRGCITATYPLATLIEAIKKVASGETFFSEEFQQYLEYDPVRKRFDAKHLGPLASLSQRQLHVMRLLAEGKSFREAARVMYITPRSIEYHAYRLMKTLECHSRVELTRFAIREGLITL